MDSRSATDPVADLAPTAMLGGIYGSFDWTLPRGRVVHVHAEAGIGAANGTTAAAMRSMARDGRSGQPRLAPAQPPQQELADGDLELVKRRFRNSRPARPWSAPACSRSTTRPTGSG